ncbi:MAG: efflux RND transporter periplasmic adaptor subunit [Alistipes sp.]
MRKLVILWIAVAAMSGCGKKNATAVQEQTKVLTKTTAALAETVVLTEEFTSEIQPYKENDITPAASGVHIGRILVDVGSSVNEGQLLLTLDPTQYNQQLVQLKTIEDDYNRLLPVYKAGGISAQQIEQAKARLDVQREVVANLKRNTEYRSPITGVVTARLAEGGDLLTGMPILHVMQINPLKVTANISEKYFTNVKQGMPVELKIDLFPDTNITGTVSLVYPALDPTTRTFTVEVKVPNSDKKLRPGMYARTRFNMGHKAGIMVPDLAVLKQVGTAESFLYVIKDGKVERRSIKLGRQVGSMIDILSGVAVGEQVAITGLSKLSDGIAVEVKNE